MAALVVAILKFGSPSVFFFSVLVDILLLIPLYSFFSESFGCSFIDSDKSLLSNLQSLSKNNFQTDLSNHNGIDVCSCDKWYNGVNIFVEQVIFCLLLFDSNVTMCLLIESCGNFFLSSLY